MTGRRSRRWTIPKGWPMAGQEPGRSCRAGSVRGSGGARDDRPVPVGSFDHTKQNLPSGLLDVRILVHPLNVDRELSKWPEVGQRRRKWFSVEEAAKKVDSEELKALIMISAERALAGQRKQA